MRTLSKRLNSVIKPAFSVHKNGTTQNNITGTQKITWSTADFDTTGDFDFTNNRFLPKLPGKYLLTSNIEWVNLSANQQILIYIYKDGAEHKYSRIQSASVTDSNNISLVVDSDGTNYFEIYAQNVSVDTADITGTAAASWFTGCKID